MLGWMRRRPRVRNAGDPAGTEGRVRQGRVVYAFGDVHGRADALDGALRRIAHDRARRPAGDTWLVALGDYVDRGPDSRGVLERLACIGTLAAGARCVLLKGNHEARMLGYLADPVEERLWACSGGRETLESYGVAPPRWMGRLDDEERAHAELCEALPEAHRAVLEGGLAASVTLDSYFFCHAGVDAGRPLDQQDEETLVHGALGLREGDHRYERTVVHGHYMVEGTVEWRTRRINLDAVAHATGHLAVLRLEGGAKEII